MFELSISFEHRDGIADLVTRLVGQQATSSGMFLPTSTYDMQFTFDTQQAAYAAALRLVNGMDTLRLINGTAADLFESINVRPI